MRPNLTGQPFYGQSLQADISLLGQALNCLVFVCLNEQEETDINVISQSQSIHNPQC